MKYCYALLFLLFFNSYAGNTLGVGIPSVSDEFHYDVYCNNMSLEDACAKIVFHTKQKVPSGQLWGMVESLIQYFDQYPLNILEMAILQEAELQKLTNFQKKPLRNIFRGKKLHKKH